MKKIDQIFHWEKVILHCRNFDGLQTKTDDRMNKIMGSELSVFNAG
jgi:hypothetical protein